jgi:hypothetical protein
LHLIGAAPNLGAGVADRAELTRAIDSAGVLPVLIVIDTVAQTMGGADENGAGMIQYTINATEIANKYRCMVLVVHHVGLTDDQRLRGHSSLNCAMDAQILCERVDKSLVTHLTLQKLKDDEDDVRLRAKLSLNILRYDEDLDPVSTLVVDSIETAHDDASGAEEEFRDAREDESNEDWKLLRILDATPGETERKYAELCKLGKTSFRRRMMKLARDKMVENTSGRWFLTPKCKRLLRETEKIAPEKSGLFD